MRQRLRELACVLFGHDWWYVNKWPAPEVVWSKDKCVGATHRYCVRCHKQEPNL
jgi:hypothetical protein